MIFVWDEDKRQINKQKHGLDFTEVINFEFDTAFEDEDAESWYNEIRIRAIGVLGNRICVLVYTMRETELRVISLRAATRKEILLYVRYQEI